MDIVYLGHSSFRIKGRNATVVTDPFDPSDVGLKYTRTEADIVTVSHQHSDHNKSDLVANKKMVIDVSGEYEVIGVSVVGIEVDHDASGGEERGKNIIFIFEIDGVRVAHFGDLGHKPSDKVVEAIGELDVMMIPVGGVYTIGPKVAAEIVKEFEPPFVIPMHYKVPGMKEEAFGKLSPVDDFLKELAYDVEKSDKLVIKKELIDYEVNKAVVLEKR